MFGTFFQSLYVVDCLQHAECSSKYMTIGGHMVDTTSIAVPYVFLFSSIHVSFLNLSCKLWPFFGTDTLLIVTTDEDIYIFWI
jgi:hypothetical protein